MLPDLEKDLVHDRILNEAKVSSHPRAASFSSPTSNLVYGKSVVGPSLEARRVQNVPQPQQAPRPPSNNFSRPLKRPSTSPARSSATATPLARTAAALRQTSSTRSSSLPLGAPLPNAPDVWHHKQASDSSSKSQTCASDRDSQLSQGSRVSQHSVVSQASQISPSLSSVESENVALARTISATESIKSSKMMKPNKRKTRTAFLKRKALVEPVSKPMISPPTLIQSKSTSQLPKLRNRQSFAATFGVDVGKALEYAKKEKHSVSDAKQDEAYIEPGLRKTETESSASASASVAGEKLRLKKTKGFGLPWSKEQRKPEDVGSLLSSGFFTRTELPPVKYTRLPVLAVSGSDIEKAQLEAANANARVSMDLAPVIWYEGKRRTVRMSWQVRQNPAVESSADPKEERNKQAGGGRVRASWIPGTRFSWLPEEDELVNLETPSGSLKSPDGDVQQSTRGFTSPTTGLLEAVEEEAQDGPKIARTLSRDEKVPKRTRAEVEDVGTDPTKQYCKEPATAETSIAELEPPESSVVGKPEGRSEVEDADNATDTEKLKRETHEDRKLDAFATTRAIDGNTELTQVLEQIAREEQRGDGYDEDGSEALFQDSNACLSSMSSDRFSLSIRKLTEALASPHHNSDEDDDNSSTSRHDDIARPTIDQNRTSWMLNTGAPSPQEVKILAAVLREGSDVQRDFEEDDDASCAADANMELKILSAYELPEQAQVLAVITEENEEEVSPSAKEGRRAQNGKDSTKGASWPMMVSSPSLPSLRMIGLAEVDEESDEIGSGSSASGSEDSILDSDESIDSRDKLEETSTDNTKAEVPHDRSDKSVAQTTATLLQPLRVQTHDEQVQSPEVMGQAPYLAGPIRLVGPEDLYRKSTIAGMDMWSDQETTESAWQRSEQWLIEGILDFFATVVRTSETIGGAEAASLFDEEEEEELSFLKAPLLDDIFIRGHAVDNIFAKERDFSKPPCLPPMPTDLPSKPLSSARSELTRNPVAVRSVTNNASSTGVSSRSASIKKPKPVAVHSPGIGSLIMKRGLF